MDGVVLRFLLLRLRLMQSDRLIGLCLRQRDQQFWIWLRRWRCGRRWRRMQQLPGLGIDAEGSLKN